MQLNIEKARDLLSSIRQLQDFTQALYQSLQTDMGEHEGRQDYEGLTATRNHLMEAENCLLKSIIAARHNRDNPS